MGRFWLRLARILPDVRRRQGLLPVTERFACFRTIGAVGELFLANLARFREKAERDGPLRLGVDTEAYEALSVPVGEMVRFLRVMGEGRYEELAQRYEALDSEMARQVFRSHPPEPAPLVVFSFDPEASRPEIVGPKAARLAQLAAEGGWKVPPHFAVTVYAFQLFTEETGVSDLVEQAEATVDLRDGSVLERFSERVTRAILSATMPARLERALDGALGRLRAEAGGEEMVAVRSSVLVEGSASSFAGPFESLLDVPPAEAGRAYKRVLASKYRPEALRNALARGLLEQDVTMPVLVMSMIRRKASGVACSRSPGHPSQVTVSSLSGLGDAEAVRVARLARSLEKRFGAAQEVEWALDESGSLWVLQARPLDDLVESQVAVAARRGAHVVTLDAAQGIDDGEDVPDRRRGSPSAAAPVQRDSVRESLRELLRLVTPLTLTDPESPTFDPEHCRTLRDIARLVQERARIEMFAVEISSRAEQRACRRLVWPKPMEVRLLDLGGAIGVETGDCVALEEVTSVPLRALLEGMMDSRLRWTGPVGFDLKGFVSVVVRSAADDQRYGEPSYALCSPEYLHFSSRLAYHFALVDALCGDSLGENYVRFRFHGGAAVAERREWRGQFLASVLRFNRFLVTHVGDRVDAILPNRPVDELEESLVMLGRLMVASRHLDMVIESPAAATVLAEAFLAGDYAFEQVRTEARV